MYIKRFGDKNQVNSSNFNATILKFSEKFDHPFSHVSRFLYYASYKHIIDTSCNLSQSNKWRETKLFKLVTSTALKLVSEGLVTQWNIHKVVQTTQISKTHNQSLPYPPTKAGMLNSAKQWTNLLGNHMTHAQCSDVTVVVTSTCGISGVKF